MIEIIVKVEFEGRNFLTNILACKGIAEDEIVRLAEEQVRKQWNHSKLVI